MSALETLAPPACALYERFLSLPSGREKPGRYWKIDLDAIDITGLSPDLDATVTFEHVPPHVTACDMETAVREHSEAFYRAFGKIADEGKFTSLARAFPQVGAFIHIPANVCADEPIVIHYTGNGQALFPNIIVVAERGARATILERIDSTTHKFICGVTEILASENAHISYAALQTLPETTRVITTRAARCERSASIAWSSAELGAYLAVGSIDTHIVNEGAHVDVTSLFFPNGSQHVDLATSIDHTAGHATSETLVKSAATGSGQGRYLGTIRIAKDAQGSDARLRDDALLLSKNAHIDSVPALEIAANDVKAFHGATVGAIDVEQLFYMESRGIPRNEAENMIALGFFEPAIARFPTETLREEIRTTLTAKIN